VNDYPALPDHIEAPAGRVSVILGINLKLEDGRDADGYFDRQARVISIDSSLPGRSRWHTYFHEAVHVALEDSGLANLYRRRELEALCDAIATARLRERFG